MSLDQYRQVIQETESMLMMDSDLRQMRGGFQVDPFAMMTLGSSGIRMMPSSGRLSPLNNLNDMPLSSIKAAPLISKKFDNKSR